VARVLEPKLIFNVISMTDMKGRRSSTVLFQAATTQDRVGRDSPAKTIGNAI
jgi:hypothetical protein